MSSTRTPAAPFLSLLLGRNKKVAERPASTQHPHHLVNVGEGFRVQQRRRTYLQSALSILVDERIQSSRRFDPCGNRARTSEAASPHSNTSLLLVVPVEPFTRAFCSPRIIPGASKRRSYLPITSQPPPPRRSSSLASTQLLCFRVVCVACTGPPNRSDRQGHPRCV